MVHPHKTHLKGEKTVVIVFPVKGRSLQSNLTFYILTKNFSFILNAGSVGCSIGATLCEGSVFVCDKVGLKKCVPAFAVGSFVFSSGADRFDKVFFYFFPATFFRQTECYLLVISVASHQSRGVSLNQALRAPDFSQKKGKNSERQLSLSLPLWSIARKQVTTN